MEMNNDFFANELKLMRERYKQNPPKMLLKDNVFETEEEFVDMENMDSLNVIYREEKTLIEKGTVFIGCIVQANENLFRRFPPFNYPADMIYSPHSVLGTDGEQLYDIAQKLFSLKGHPQNAPEELRQLVLWITDEMTRCFNVPLPDCLTNGKEVYFTTFTVIRKNLPGKKIRQRLLPILAAPESCKSSTVLPRELWSQGFIDYFWND